MKLRYQVYDLLALGANRTQFIVLNIFVLVFYSSTVLTFVNYVNVIPESSKLGYTSILVGALAALLWMSFDIGQKTYSTLLNRRFGFIAVTSTQLIWSATILFVANFVFRGSVAATIEFVSNQPLIAACYIATYSVVYLTSIFIRTVMTKLPEQTEIRTQLVDWQESLTSARSQESPNRDFESKNSKFEQDTSKLLENLSGAHTAEGKKLNKELNRWLEFYQSRSILVKYKILTGDSFNEYDRQMDWSFEDIEEKLDRLRNR